MNKFARANTECSMRDVVAENIPLMAAFSFLIERANTCCRLSIDTETNFSLSDFSSSDRTFQLHT